MSTTLLTALIARCRVLGRPRSPTADAELLKRFAQRHDATAFEELLERYASLVWGVCRRILPSESDCEDAFQATFLALVRRPDAIAPSSSLGAWLHTVAVRVARKTQARTRRQRPQAVLPEPTTNGDVADEIGSRELFRLVDEEIERLPESLRLPLILCCLQGRTRDEAAAVLGCSVAAVKGRLERGRELLRRRLERRGVQLPVAFLVLGLTAERVRAVLWAKTMQAVLYTPTPAIVALAEAGASALTFGKGKLLLAMVLLATTTVGAVGSLLTTTKTPEPPSTTPTERAAAEPKKPQPPQVRTDRYGDPLPEGAIRRFGTSRFRFDGYTKLDFTPDGKQLIAGGRGCPLVVFDAVTGRKLRELGNEATEQRWWRGFALSPDGKRVAGCGFQAIYLWEFTTGRLIHKIYSCDDCKEVAFASNGTTIAAIKESRPRVGEMQTKIIVVNAASETLPPKIVAEQMIAEGKPLEYSFRGITFSPDGKYLAGRFSQMREEQPAIHRDVSSQVWLLDASTGARVRTIGSADIPGAGFAFQPDSGRLATYGKDGTIRFWETATGKEVRHFEATKGKEEGDYAKLRFSSDGRRCAVAMNRGKYLSVLDTKDGRVIRRLEGEENALRIDIALSADGKSVASAQSWNGSCVRVWDVDSGSERLADAGHREAVTTLSFTPDERMLISRDESGRTIQWDRRTTQGNVQPFDARAEMGQFVWRRDFSRKTLLGPRWRMVYKNQWPAILEIRSLDDSRTIAKREVPGRLLPTVALSPTGTHLAVVPNNQSTLWLWNPEREENPRRFALEAEMCSQLLFSHDGKRLIARTSLRRSNFAGILQVWDVAAGKVVRKKTNIAPGGPLLLTGDDRLLLLRGEAKDTVVHVWHIETGTDRAALTIPAPKPAREENDTRNQSWIAALALAPDERFLAVVATAGEESTVSVWETASWKRILTFPPTHAQNKVPAMIFSHDGRSLFVSNGDSTILEWDVCGRAAGGRHQSSDNPLNKDRLNTLWQTLLETPDRAYPAAWELLDRPTESVPFLADKLLPVAPVDEKRVRQLMAQLDCESFAEREEASQQLVALGEPALPLVRQALENNPSLEMRKRLEGAIASLPSSLSPAQLRQLRALAVLEWSGTAAADKHLRRLAAGAECTLTKAAQAALRRGAGKSRPQPR